MDKIQTSVVVLIGVGVVAIIAGFNEGLGKVLALLMIIFAILWFIGSIGTGTGPSGLVTKYFGQAQKGVTLA